MTTITLTLNKETRTVEVIELNNTYIVMGLKLVTTKGAQQHTGRITLKPNANNTYTQADIINIYYKGMRGNGTAERSQFRYIGF